MAEHLCVRTASRVAGHLDPVVLIAIRVLHALGEVERLPELRIPGIAEQQRLLQPGHLRAGSIGGRRGRSHQIQQFAIAVHGDVRPFPVQRIVAAADGDDDALFGLIDEGVDDETGGGAVVDAVK